MERGYNLLPENPCENPVPSHNCIITKWKNQVLRGDKNLSVKSDTSYKLTRAINNAWIMDKLIIKLSICRAVLVDVS